MAAKKSVSKSTKAKAAASKSLTAPGFSYMMGLGSPVFGVTGEYTAIASEGYASNIYVSQCVDKIADAVASSAKWLLYEKQADGSLAEITDHPLLSLLADPNPQTGGGEFLKKLVSYYELSGNGYVLAIDNGSGTPGALMLVQPNIVSVKRGSAVGEYIYSVKMWDNSTANYTGEQLLHLKTFNPLSDLTGISPAFKARYSIDALNDAHVWNLSLLQNDMRPAGLLTVDSDNPLTTAQQEQLRQAMTGYTGAKSAGKLPLLNARLKWTPLSTTPHEADWLAAIALHAREVCTAYGVPSVLLSDTENSKYSNYETARAAFFEETVLPLLDKLTGELNRWLTPRYGENLILSYDRDAIQALAENNDKLYSRLSAAKFLTINEIREQCGYEALPPEIGDVLNNAPAQAPAPVAGAASLSSLETKGLTPEQKALAHTHAAIDRRRERWVAPVRKQVKAIFDDERRAAMLGYAASGEEGAIKAVHDSRDRWNALLVATYRSVGEDFARQTLRSISNQKDLSPEHIKANVFTDTMLRYLATRAATQVLGIEDTTVSQLQTIIGDGVASGFGIDKIAKSIDLLYLDNIIPNRSEVIARTESLAAGNIASDAAAKSAGVALTKTWKCNVDGRQRGTHQDANNQTVDNDQPFTVGGEQMMFPMDNSLGASAENVIQCRCAAIYRRKTA